MRSLSTIIRVQGVTLALALLASAASHAQGGAVSISDPMPAVNSFEEELSRFGERYWGEKQDGYRERIDRLLLAEDLATLNRLRIRWMLLTEKEKSMRENPSPTVSGEDEVRFGLDAETEKEVIEMLDILVGAGKLAESYRQELDGIGNDVVDDLFSFLDLLGDRIRTMQNEQPELAAESGVATRLSLLELWKKMYTGNGEKRTFMAVYPIAVEPMILLYGGADPGTIFDRVGEANGIFGGIALPESSVLRQNVPNPASSATKITYVLAGPSSATTLRLFDARGDLQGSYDLGELSAGEHAFDLDVSSLPSGSYLYHLTLRTGGGERVYVKAMQVVR